MEKMRQHPGMPDPPCEPPSLAAIYSMHNFFYNMSDADLNFDVCIR